MSRVSHIFFCTLSDWPVATGRAASVEKKLSKIMAFECAVVGRFGPSL